MSDIKINPYRYYPPRRHTDRVVTDDELLFRWRAGLDTYAIALQVGIPESEVANRLPHIREERRKIAEWNIDVLLTGSE